MASIEKASQEMHNDPVVEAAVQGIYNAIALTGVTPESYGLETIGQLRRAVARTVAKRFGFDVKEW